MVKQSFATLPLTALFAILASAQSSSDTGDAGITPPMDPCPTETTTTITLPTTVTLCPGPNCNGGSMPLITPGPAGPGVPGIHLGEFTSVGPDGKTTVLGLYETVFDALGDDGMTQVTYTVTEPCPDVCHKTLNPTVMPSGFETTVVPCHVCEKTGGPTTITLTQPCPTGPYATQTPASNPATTTSVDAAPVAPSDVPVDDQSTPTDTSVTPANTDVNPARIAGNDTTAPSAMIYTGSANKQTYAATTFFGGLLSYFALF